MGSYYYLIRLRRIAGYVDFFIRVLLGFVSRGGRVYVFRREILIED